MNLDAWHINYDSDFAPLLCFLLYTYQSAFTAYNFLFAFGASTPHVRLFTPFYKYNRINILTAFYSANDTANRKLSCRLSPWLSQVGCCLSIVSSVWVTDRHKCRDTFQFTETSMNGKRSVNEMETERSVCCSIWLSG